MLTESYVKGKTRVFSYIENGIKLKTVISIKLISGIYKVLILKDLRRTLRSQSVGIF